MVYILSVSVYLIVGSVLVLFYIGAAGYPHRFSWKMLWKRLLEKDNALFIIGVIIVWLPLLITIVGKSLWDRMK